MALSPRRATLSETQRLMVHRGWLPSCLNHIHDRLHGVWPLVQLVFICLYVGAGVLYYKFAEGWDGIDAMYFSMVTMSTVGYGDLTPDNTQARIITVLYALLGLLIIFNYVSDLMTTLTQPCFDAIRDWVERHFPTKGHDLDGNGQDDYHVPLHPVLFYASRLLVPLLLTLTIQLVAAACYVAVEGGANASSPLANFGNAFYFCLITVTTVGYGDMSPKSREGRIFAFFHISAAVSLLGMFIGQVDTAREERRQQLQRQRLMLAKLDEEVWQSILPQGKEHIDKFDFVYGMLTKLELVSESDIQVFSKMFEKYDHESEGKLERVAINDIARAYQRQGSMLAAQRRQTSFITTAKRSSMAFLARSTSVAGVAQSRSDLEPSARAGAVSTSLSSEQLQMSVP